MVFVVRIVFAQRFHDGLLAGKVLSYLRGVGFAVGNSLPDGFQRQLLVRGNFLGRHGGFFADMFAVERPSRDPAVLNE